MDNVQTLCITYMTLTNETVFLYLYEKNHRLSVAKEMRDTKLRVEQAKKRIKE